jgi:hypothetical protein
MRWGRWAGIAGPWLGSGGETAGRKTDKAAADLVVRLQNDRFCILAECCGDCLAWSR